MSAPCCILHGGRPWLVSTCCTACVQSPMLSDACHALDPAARRQGTLQTLTPRVTRSTLFSSWASKALAQPTRSHQLAGLLSAVQEMLSSMLEEAISHCCNFTEDSSSESEGHSGSEDSDAEDAPGKACLAG